MSGPPPDARRRATQSQRAILGAILGLLGVKILTAVLLALRATGVEWQWIPETSTTEALRAGALWLVGAWLVQRRHIAGWGMMITIAGLSIFTSWTIQDRLAWDWVSLVTSIALVVLLLAPPMLLLFVRPAITPSPSRTDNLAAEQDEN